MAEEGFRFKQFNVRHDRSSMKVGTDAVLLGSWANCTGPRVLDIGTGCGVIALMMAQRFPESNVVGIDIDEDSISEANDNALQSPFAGRIRFENADVRTMQCDTPFDCIVCNPPYYTEDTLPPDERRSKARNTAALSFAALARCAARLLAPKGCFSVVLPTKEVENFVCECATCGLHLCRRCDVRTTPRKQPKRSMLSFCLETTACTETETLTLMNPDGSRSETYATLAGAFYL